MKANSIDHTPRSSTPEAIEERFAASIASADEYRKATADVTDEEKTRRIEAVIANSAVRDFAYSGQNRLALESDDSSDSVEG